MSWLPEQHIHLCLILSTPLSIAPEVVVQSFEDYWGSGITCSGNEKRAEPEAKERKLLIENGTHSMLLTVAEYPIPGHLMEITLLGAPELDDNSRRAFEGHKAHMLLDYVEGSKDAADGFRFAAKILLSLFKYKEVLGVVNTPAVAYRPRGLMEPLIKDRELDAAFLFVLFTNMHFVDEHGSYWIHTHGMEQFGLPDVEVRFSEREDWRYYRELVGNASIYMIENGPVLKPGETAELGKDGTVYRISNPRKNKEHRFGVFSSIELVRQAN